MTSPHADRPDPLPDDLLGVAAALDRLARAEGDALSPEALARLHDLTSLTRVQTHLAADARAVADAAPEDQALEPRVFARSRAALQAPASAPIPFPATRPAQTPVITWRRTARLAAAVAIFAGGSVALRAFWPTTYPRTGNDLARSVPPPTIPTSAEPGTVTAAPDAAETVFALVASIDTTARRHELEQLVDEADGLMASLREPARTPFLSESFTERQ